MQSFYSVKAGKYAIIPVSEKLARSEIEKVFVSTDKTALSTVDQRLNVVEVTSKFGSYVKMSPNLPVINTHVHDHVLNAMSDHVLPVINHTYVAVYCLQ